MPLPAVPVSFVEDPTERFATLEYRTAVDDYMRDEVLPYVPDAWVDHDRTKIGYEIPLTRHFYKYVPPRPLEEIDAEIKALEDEIQRLLAEVAGMSNGADASRDSSSRRSIDGSARDGRQTLSDAATTATSRTSSCR